MSPPAPSPASASLAEILRGSALVWRGTESPHPKTISAGFAHLDECLPGGGWPLGNLIEIIPACEGVGELSVCLPVLAALCRQGRRIALEAPPHVPHAPGLRRARLALDSLVWVDADRDEDARWAAAQLLRDGNAGGCWSVEFDPG
jgi:protein ImuA